MGFISLRFRIGLKFHACGTFAHSTDQKLKIGQTNLLKCVVGRYSFTIQVQRINSDCTREIITHRSMDANH